MSAVLRRLTTSRPYRAYQRYGQARGGLLAGGIAYLGFFSILPALVLGFAVFGFVLRSQPDLFSRVVGSVSQTLPGIVQDGAHPDGLLDASAPPAPNALTLTGAVSLVVMVASGLGWVAALREGVRAMFGEGTFQVNPVLGKLRDLGILVSLGLAVLLSATASFVVNAAGSWLLGLLRVGDGSAASTVLLRVLGVVVVLAADLALMVVILRFLSGLSLSGAQVLPASMVGAVGLGVLKLAGGLLVASADRKPLLAGFAVVIGLLLLLNLIARVVLVSAAWAATAVADQAHLAAVTAAPVPGLVPGSSSVPRADGPRADVLPRFGVRSTDRVSLAAGAVLGMAAAVAVRGARDGLRAVVGAVRGR